ncbi:FAD-binding oxidoreductase [Leptothermofonsia sichuanensis E412]|uniref:NAD(P)/FAD-dependent oxidoreductase n=1 Tax=Leptothermofonsia sichuanensis TaxID=2917832 RepID=UPI001CA7611C|nr:FAD-binding oxidoreductase [Leptothermofonsia sichuanensis]QZZ22783.1 FAD-binding oxidoreductase [Leptothermofonsia sichuanensis E412]
MKPFDWIVIGAGITGAALSYELARQGFSVLLLERHDRLRGSTRFGYGGLAYWSGTTDLTRQICAEGKAIHQTLSEELEADTQFRELDLVLTIAPDGDPEAITRSYAHFADPPRFVSVAEACELEPLLNPAAMAGALTVKHGHIAPEVTAQAYTQAFIRLGGTIQVEQASGLLRNQDAQVRGVICGEKTYSSANVAICAGALSRSLLRQSGISVPIYFTHAELIETPPVDVTLRTLVMPADTQRFQLEANASRADLDSLWDEPGHEPAPYILDAGAIQLKDGSFRIGQVSRVLTDPEAPVDAETSESEIRARVGTILPALKNLPGRWHHCLIAFSRDRLPLIGAIPGIEGVHLFSGFSNPLAIVPALARRFAQHAAGNPDELITQLAPDRFHPHS